MGNKVEAQLSVLCIIILCTFCIMEENICDVLNLHLLFWRLYDICKERIQMFFPSLFEKDVMRQLVFFFVLSSHNHAVKLSILDYDEDTALQLIWLCWILAMKNISINIKYLDNNHYIFKI